MGHFNSQIGRLQDGESKTIGCCTGKINKNGQKLEDFTQEYNLKIMNTLFKKM